MGKKLVVSVLGVVMLCVIHGTTVENILFEDNGINTFRAFNPTQVFLHLKEKMLLTRHEARANMLTIILLRNEFLKIYIFYIITSK